MGYFPRKIRRGTARDHIRTTHKRSVDEGWWERWIEAVPPTDDQRWYLRFSVRLRDQDSGQRTGIFVAAGLYEEEGADGVPPHEREALQRLLRWFNENLPVPSIDDARAVFFFKSDAEACARVWELVHLLRDLGSPPEMVCTRDPGQIVFEDAFQVAAIPGR